MRGKGGKEERAQKAWRWSAIEEFDTTSELTLFQVTGCCKACGYRAATQIKGLCPEITTVPVVDIVAKRWWL